MLREAAYADDSEDSSEDIVVDESGNVYMTGYFEGAADFDPGPGGLFLLSNGARDRFAAKFHSDGAINWVRYVGGTGFDYGFACSIDVLGSIYWGTAFSGTIDADTGAGEMLITSGGGTDGIVHKLSLSGELLWARVATGADSNSVSALAVDAARNVLAGGSFRGSVSVGEVVDPITLDSAGDVDGLFMKFQGPGVPGDIDGNGVADAVDIQYVINAVLGLGIPVAFDADVNGDDAVDAADIQEVINGVLGTR